MVRMDLYHTVPIYVLPYWGYLSMYKALHFIQVNPLVEYTKNILGCDCYPIGIVSRKQFYM